VSCFAIKSVIPLVILNCTDLCLWSPAELIANTEGFECCDFVFAFTMLDVAFSRAHSNRKTWSVLLLFSIESDLKVACLLTP